MEIEKCTTLDEARTEIDKVDEEIVKLIAKRNNYIKAGSNSGFAAINVAYHLGATRIYLLGYDMNSSVGQTHWHNGYNIRHDDKIYARNMISNFDNIASILKDENIEIFNVNTNNKLKGIPKCTMEQALINDI